MDQKIMDEIQRVMVAGRAIVDAEARAAADCHHTMERVRVSLAVRSGWVIFTNGTFVVGMMTLAEAANGGRPLHYDLIHVSADDISLRDLEVAAAVAGR